MFKYLSEVYGKGGIYAKCVAASIANGISIYTIETKAPKFIDAEFEKHRMLSSNSSSSRAIPFKKLDEIYLPFDIRKNQKGMQGYDSVSENGKDFFLTQIRSLYNHIIDGVLWWHSQACADNPYTGVKDDWAVHKQHLNRYIEPWMFQKKVVTATEWDNFFKLRLHPDAQPEIQELARCMKEAIDRVVPIELTSGEWHLPYITADDRAVAPTMNADYLQLVSAGRCARVSYNNIHSDKPPEKLATDLLIKKHMTPFEHQATPMKEITEFVHPDAGPWWELGITHKDRLNNYWSANFRGWIQYRKQIDKT